LVDTILAASVRRFKVSWPDAYDTAANAVLKTLLPSAAASIPNAPASANPEPNILPRELEICPPVMEFKPSITEAVPVQVRV